MNTAAIRNYWLLSSGKDGELWPIFWNDRVVAVGWSAVGDLRQYSDREKLGEALRAAYPGGKTGQYRNNLTQLWSFYHGVAKGEVIFVRSYGAIIGIGEVQSDYEYLSADDPLRKRLYSAYFDDELSLSISRLQEWVGEASDRAQDRGIRPEEERAGKWAGGPEEQDGLAGKGKEAENDEAHRALVGVWVDPRGPN